MFQKKIKKIFGVLILLTAGMLTSCGQEQDTDNQETQVYESASQEEEAVEELADATATVVPSVSENETESESTEESKSEAESESTIGENTAAEDMKEKFGENCIPEQTFEVELSEYEGKVYFVSLAPEEEKPEFRMQIVQNGKVLTEIEAYVPSELEGEKFTSLDAVSFYDVNYDNNTDIVLIETYGGTSFAAVYYGHAAESEDYESFFSPQEELSEILTSQVEQLSILEIRNFLSNGKKNGSFESFQEAYEAVSRLCELEDNGENSYNLIYFNGDDIPELVAGKNDYYTSLYTYDNGTVYTLMDHWVYGAMGNVGYEYVARKNSMRNYNSDYAGAIRYTTYMAMNSQHSWDTVAEIVTYNFDDVNKNGMPDENEEDSIGYYSVSYINDKEVSEEECASYDVGEYEYIEGKMNLEELKAELRNK